MASIELMYRKTILKSVYRFSKLFDEIMNYEEYKQIILNNQSSDFKYISYIKGVNECYNYILRQATNEFDIENIKTMHKLLFQKEILNEKVEKLKEAYKVNNTLVGNANNLFNEIKDYCTYDRYALAYVLLNYLIYLERKRFYNISNMFCIYFYQMVNENDYSKLEEELEIEYKKSLTPVESYYDHLEEIKQQEIIDFLFKNKEEINERFQIEHLYLYGSFIKNTQRIDSDIDLAGEFSIHLTYVEKYELVVMFKNYVLSHFKRYGDFMEFSEELLKGEEYKKIF